MSADTPEGRAAEEEAALVAIEGVLSEYLPNMFAHHLREAAQEVLAALPPSCDFDCDACRE
jgi:hypothetical protein